MTPAEELALISTLLDEHSVPKTRGLGIYSVYGRVALLAEKAAQHSVQLEDWAQVVYENCGKGEDFSVSLYDVVMEIREALGYYERPTKRAADLWDSAPLQSLSTPEADTSAEVLSTPPTSG